MDDLDPRDSLEVAQAHRIAQLYLLEQRMDRWEAAALRAAMTRPRFTQMLVAHNHENLLISHIAEWNSARLDGGGEGEVPRPRAGSDERLLSSTVALSDPANVSPQILRPSGTQLPPRVPLY